LTTCQITLTGVFKPTFRTEALILVNFYR